MRRPRCMLPALLLAALTSPAQAGDAVCHYAYGGETQTLRALPTASPFAVPAVRVGSYLRFRVVVEAEPAALAALKTYVYEERDGGPALVHQGVYPWPASEAPGRRHGFTGLQRVYESAYGSELEYWCALATAAEAQ
ncbi:hypothetical protein [Azospira restricta]|nr:hypothetical protein [Azospira restricta]